MISVRQGMERRFLGRQVVDYLVEHLQDAIAGD
jgi:hypothetical protein